MSKLVYVGNMNQEVKYFEGHDKTIVDYLNSVAKDIGELNKNWNDEVSGSYLGEFNNLLNECKVTVDKAHDAVFQYFTDIANVLNVWGSGGTVEMPTLEKLDTVIIAQSKTDGSILYDIDVVRETLTNMKNIVHSACSDIEDFKPTVVSLAGSSDDILSAVQSNLTAAANSYLPIATPLQNINTTVSKVLEIYEQKASAISNATAGSN